MYFMLSFYFIMSILGVFVVISGSSWMSVWMGLELNMFMFLVYLYLMSLNTSSLFKYFFMQSISSLVLIHLMISFKEIKLDYLVVLVAMMKMGLSPFHFWYMGMLKELNWGMIFMLSFPQKISPLVILFYSSKGNESLLMNMGLFSLVFSLVSVWNEYNLRLIIGYSSINHLGWVMILMSQDLLLWMVYFILYLFVFCSVVYVFSKLQLFYISSMFNKNGEYSLVLSLFSLGGFPPMMGFFPKWMCFWVVSGGSSVWLMSLMVISSVGFMFIYLRLVLLMGMFSSWSEWNSKFKGILNTMLMNFFVSMGFIWLAFF